MATKVTSGSALVLLFSCSQVTSMLLQQTTTQHWLPEQLRYISKQAKKLMGNDDSSTGTSSADRLLAYLKKLKRENLC